MWVLLSRPKSIAAISTQPAPHSGQHQVLPRIQLSADGVSQLCILA